MLVTLTSTASLAKLGTGACIVLVSHQCLYLTLEPKLLFLSFLAIFLLSIFSSMSVKVCSSFISLFDGPRGMLYLYKIPSDCLIHLLLEFFYQYSFFKTTSSYCCLEFLYKLLHYSSFLFY